MEQGRQPVAEEVTEYICASEDCETDVEQDSYMSPINLESYCWDCMDYDLQHSSTLYRFVPGHKADVVRFGDIAVMNEYGDEPGEWFWDLFDGKVSRDWHPTDGWRGYMSSMNNISGATTIAEGWTTGWVDDSVGRKMIFNEWLSDLTEGEIAYRDDIYVMLEPTSNVFSVGVAVFTFNDDLARGILQETDLKHALS